jgi:hypothetical protein
MTAYDARTRLAGLQVERAHAADAGLTANRLYMADLEEEIAEWRQRFVTAAVGEIARLRAALSGPLEG